jgi:ATP-dependent helicase/nuclease subunit A
MRVRVAGAGTGKTTSLVRRYLQLIDEGVPLRRIGGVTFTRASATELRERVGEGLTEMLSHGTYLGGLERLAEGRRPRFEDAARELGGATIATIHGFMIHALRLVAPALGLDPDFGLLGEWEARAMMEEELRSLRFLAEQPGATVAGLVRAAGEDSDSGVMALFEARSLTSDLRPAGAAAAALVALFEAGYDRYRARLGAALLAPGEIEREALRLVASPALTQRVVARYPVLLVDEYQDVNPLQGEMFERLAAAGARVEVVGDPKQSIYGFRHADVEVFRRAAAVARASGTLEPPLVETRRHARRVAAFLNHVTSALAERGLGFGIDEAPAVTPVGPQAERDGAVACLYWRDESTPLATLRAAEAAGLAARLRDEHRERGLAYREMAVLARSRASLEQVRSALQGLGVPAVLRQGRGVFERVEVRDLYHALRVALDPGGASLAAFLRGPFAGLPLADIERAMRSADPVATLEREHADAAASLRAVRERVRGASPVTALARLMRDELVGGRPFVAALEPRARDNVDAVLFEIAAAPPVDVERLLDRLDLLARDTEAGDVPQAGNGVQLVTVHAAKGLEWPLVAVFDAGGAAPAWRDGVVVAPRDGRVALPDDDAYDELARGARDRRDAEAYRTLYVALTRAREVLIVTGSQGPGTPSPWLRALNVSGIGPAGDGEAARRLGVEREVQGAQAAGRAVAGALASALPPASAPWTGRRFARPQLPPVVSPSWVLVEGAGRAPPGATRPGAAVAPGGDEPLRDPGRDALPGRGSAVGTLVHDAIARGWHPEDAGIRPTLAAQEVLWPFADGDREALVDDALEMLGAYHAMLRAAAIPPASERDEDHAELPFALPDERRGTVWQGVIDRVYRVGERWFLDDYKTDLRLDARRYHLSLAVYVEAFAAVRGVRPEARLVDLRRQRVVTLAPGALSDAWAAARPSGATR